MHDVFTAFVHPEVEGYGPNERRSHLTSLSDSHTVECRSSVILFVRLLKL